MVTHQSVTSDKWLDLTEPPFLPPQTGDVVRIKRGSCVKPSGWLPAPRRQAVVESSSVGAAEGALGPACWDWVLAPPLIT